MLVFMQGNEYGSPFTTNDRIFLGEGLFETLKVSEAKPCYPEYHWQRLQKAAFFLGIDFELTLEAWIANLKAYISLKGLTSGGIKAILSAGSAVRGLLEPGREARLILTSFDYSPSSKPLHLMSASWRRDAGNPIYQLKSINYLEAIIARRYAQTAEADDVLFFNTEQHATETSIANFFIIKDQCLLTPPLESGVLAGIIRQRLFALCSEQNIDCKEFKLSRALIYQAEAAFTCNVLQGIRAVSRLDEHYFSGKQELIGRLIELLSKDALACR